MEKLIEALQILLKYGNPDYPTHCEHDVMYIMDIEPELISKEDKKKLSDLGFIVTIAGEKTDDEDDETADQSEIFSYRYG